MYLPTKAQEKQRPLNPAFLYHLAVVEMGEQHIKCRKVPAPKPKFHLPSASGLSMTGSCYSTWLPEVAGDNPDILNNEVWNSLYFQVGEGAGGSGWYPIKHIPWELRSEASGKTLSHNSTFSNTQEQWFRNSLFTALLGKSIAFIRTSAQKNKHTLNFTFNFRGVHGHLLPITHSQHMDPRFKPCPLIRQTKTGLEVDLLLNSLSTSSLATNHVSGPSWSSRTVAYSAKGKNWTQPQFQMQGWGEQGIEHSRCAHRNSEEAPRKVNQIWCDLRLLQIRP